MNLRAGISIKVTSFNLVTTRSFQVKLWKNVVNCQFHEPHLVTHQRNMVSTRARRKDGRGSLKAKDKGAAAAETTPAKSKVPAAKPAAAATAGKKGKKGKGKGKEKEKVKVKGKGKAVAKIVVEEKVALVEEEVAQRVAFTRAPRRALSCLGAVSTEPLVPTGTADPGLHAGKVVSGRWWKAEHKR